MSCFRIISKVDWYLTTVFECKHTKDKSSREKRQHFGKLRVLRLSKTKIIRKTVKTVFYLHLWLEVSQLLLNIPVSIERKRYINKYINVAKCNLGKVKLQANVVSGLLLKRTWSEGCPQGPFAYLVTYVASHAGIFELIFADLLLSESLRILAFNCKICLALEALEALVTVKMLPFAPPVQRIVRPHRRFHRILLLALRNP